MNSFARAAFLSVATLSAIAFWAMAVYTDGALAGNVPADGYGVSATMLVSGN